MKPLIIIPVFNEEKNLGRVIAPILDSEIFDVLVIDDGSEDSSFEVARSYGVSVIRNKSNLGKGASLKKGFEYGIRNGHESIITSDGDGQHKFEDILTLYNAWMKSDADIVIGNRMWHPVGMPYIRRVTNRIMSKLISFMTKSKIPDTQCGLKLIRSKILKEINISSNKFEVESEILFQVLKKGYKVLSVNISSVYFSKRKSHIRPLRDTFRFVRFLAKAIFTK